MKQNFIISLAAGTIAVMVTACTNLDVNVESQYVNYPNTDIAQEAELLRFGNLCTSYFAQL